MNEISSIRVTIIFQQYHYNFAHMNSKNETTTTNEITIHIFNRKPNYLTEISR